MMDVQDDSKPWGLEWRPGRDFRTVAELYTKRNLWALAAYAEARRRILPEMQCLDIPLSGCCLSCSRMLTEANRQITKGTYYIPQVSRCIKLSNALDYRFRNLGGVQEGILSKTLSRRAISSNESALRLNLPPNCIDYAFLDPPYAGTVQYGELNFVWESWLGFSTEWLAEEIVVNSFRHKSIEDWDHDMRIALGRLYESLKPGRWVSICYHDTDPATWSRVQDLLRDVGFEMHTVTVLDPLQKSSNQSTAEKVVKSDLVLNCLKPRPGEAKQQETSEVELVSHRVRDVLIETLSKTGGQTRDKLWDAILKRLLTRGQMAAHRFDDILAEVAFRSESRHWFLREEFEQLSHSDIRNEEDAGAALERFTRLRSEGVPVQFAAHIALHAPNLGAPDADEEEIEQYVQAHLVDDPVAAKKFKLSGRMRGIEFYDCLFFYLTRYLKGRAGGKTPRRNVAEFMEEYLVRFKEGDTWLYRPADRAESQGLKKSRETGLGRRIRQYCAFLHGEGDIPKEKMPDAKTLIAWVKHCAAFGLADEGVLLFEKGGLAGQTHQLGEDDRYDAEDYYERPPGRVIRCFGIRA
jgi:hypothetical protein